MTTPTQTAATGPKTTEGKRVAARNATTHGLFARDVVLPHLGEDPAGYEAFTAELTAQISPQNLLEQHYTEKIAAASWRLRRLHRWQAQLFEDPALSNAEALEQLGRALRHETTLHRQIDTSVRMMGRELAGLFEGRFRKQMMAGERITEAQCRGDLYLSAYVQQAVRKRLPAHPLPPDFDRSRLDATPAPPQENCRKEDCQDGPAAPHTQICQNEPAPACTGEPYVRPSSPAYPNNRDTGEVASLGEPEGVPPVRMGALRRARKLKQLKKCQNEPAPDPCPDPPTVGGPCDRGTREQGGGLIGARHWPEGGVFCAAAA